MAVAAIAVMVSRSSCEASLLTKINQIRFWRFPAAACICALAAMAAIILNRTLDETGLAMTLLTGVIVSAATLGAYPAYFAAILTFIFYNYYLVEPRFTFQMTSPEDYFVLAFFLAVAVVTGGLAGRLSDQVRRSRLRARASSALFEASRRLSAAADEDVIRRHLVEHIAAAAKGQAILADGGRTWTCPDELETASIIGEDVEPPNGWQVRTIEADGISLGVAAWRTPDDERPDTERDRLIDVLIDLGAAAVLRARLSSAQADLLAASKTEQLRAALLSSISHDLRTPLAAILASATSLKTFGGQFPPDVQRDLLTTIEEEAERLNRFVANLLSMTKLESGSITLQSQPVDVGEVVNRTADRIGAYRRRAVERAGHGESIAHGDPILLEQALGNVIENAARYSPPGGPIMVR